MTEMRVVIRDIELAAGARLGRITLDNPKALNAIRLDMIEPIQQALSAWEADDAVVCILIDAAGDKAFCAGGDIVSLYRSAIGEGDPDYPARFFCEEYRLCHDLHRLRTPVIAWGHGVVMGGGLGVFAGARHRVVTETAKLAMPEIKIGLFPDVGATWFFNRMPHAIGLFIALTGSTLGPADALFTGLATHALRHAQQADLVNALAGVDDWQDPQASVAQVLNTVTGDTPHARPGDAPLGGRLDILSEVTRAATLAEIVDRITALAGHDDDWLAEGARNLAAGCPATAQLIYRQLGSGRYLSLAEVAQQELAMALACCERPDFAEGVRALLIDKDKQPDWRFKQVADVPTDYIDAHFQPRWANEHPLADL